MALPARLRRQSRGEREGNTENLLFSDEKACVLMNDAKLRQKAAYGIIRRGSPNRLNIRRLQKRENVRNGKGRSIRWKKMYGRAG